MLIEGDNIGNQQLEEMLKHAPAGGVAATRASGRTFSLASLGAGAEHDHYSLARLPR